MANPKHRVIRGKMIKQDNLLLDSREDGSLHIRLGSTPPPDGNMHGRLLELSEEDAVLLNELLDDMIEWKPDEPADITSP